MSIQSFSPLQRLAIFEIHGERCFWCTKPLGYNAMHVDHVIPESIGRRKFLQLRNDYRLKAGFQLNGYENLVPSCAPDNLAKCARVFDECPALIRYIAIVAERAPKVSAYIEKKKDRLKQEKEAALRQPDCLVSARWKTAGSVEISVCRHKLVRGRWMPDRDTEQKHLFAPAN